MGLYDGILIKDNHIKVLGGMKKTLQHVREKKIKEYKIECDNYNQVKLCIESGARYLLLDNMSVNPKVKTKIPAKAKARAEAKAEAKAKAKAGNVKKI